MNLKGFVFEYIAPAIIVVGLVYAIIWSVIDFTQGGL